MQSSDNRDNSDKALDELATSKGKRWNIGMELPPGHVPWLNYGVKGDSESTVAATDNAFGKHWVCDYPKEINKKDPDEPDWDDYPKVRGNENIAFEVMKLTGTRYVWIIAVNHSVKLCYDENGQRIPIWVNGKRTFKTEAADEHMTIRLGMDENTCMLHGHVYVTVDEIGNPTGLMKKEDRKCITLGDDRILELWEYTGSSNAGPGTQKRTARKRAPYQATAQQRHRQKAVYGLPTLPPKHAKSSRPNPHRVYKRREPGPPPNSAKPNKQNSHRVHHSPHRGQTARPMRIHSSVSR